jgi:hypothetical protein
VFIGKCTKMLSKSEPLLLSRLTQALFSMRNHSLTIVWLATLALPCLIYLVGNPFPTGWSAAVRTLIAVLVGWALTLGYASIAQDLTVYGPEQINGAALAFSAIFGWVPAADMLSLTWAASRGAKRWLRSKGVARPTSLVDSV